uniref:Uncharacterized protein n=1 Tax=Ignisphaera aggregans TaxID=334771 RepID=A0A7C5UWV4_9CREN
MIRLHIVKVIEFDGVDVKYVEDFVNRVLSLYPNLVVVYMHCVYGCRYEGFWLIDPATGVVRGDKIFNGNCVIDVLPVEVFAERFSSRELILEYHTYSKRIVDLEVDPRVWILNEEAEVAAELVAEQRKLLRAVVKIEIPYLYKASTPQILEKIPHNK